MRGNDHTNTAEGFFSLLKRRINGVYHHVGGGHLKAYRLTAWMQIVGEVTNLFDRKYYTAGQLGPFGFTDTGAYIARPLPAVNGQFPVQPATFYAPGAPARVWVGTRFKF